MKSMKKRLVEQLAVKVQQLCAEREQTLPTDFAVIVEQPAHLEHGDYATNVAMQLARVLRQAPMQIAEQLVPYLSAIPFVDRVEVARPGFINFFLDWHVWYALQQEEEATEERLQEKVIVEHTSINPNKAAHVGHLRNSCIGDTLARLYRKLGYETEVHNYIDDLGNQVADTVVGLFDIPLKGEYDRFGDYCWDLYAKVNQLSPEELQQKRADVLHSLETGDDNQAWVGALVAERIVREQLQDMSQFGISYDLLIWESDIVRRGFWQATFELLQKSPLFVKEQEGNYKGCWVLKQEGTGEQGDTYNPDKVLVRSSGVLTYTAKDIAYHLWKFGILERDFTYQRFDGGLWSSAKQGSEQSFGQGNKVINVIDERQEYPQRMVRLALETLGYEQEANRLHHVGYGVVSLSRNTAERIGIDTSDQRNAYPMSGRKGIGIKVSDLLNQMEQVVEEVRPRKEGIASREIAAAAIRYYLLRFNLQTEIVFDLDQAADLQGNSGVYLMYQHARAAKILRDSEQEVEQLPFAPPTSLLVEERALLRHLAEWPDILQQAANDLNLSLLTNYVYELASAFSRFYNAAPIFKSEPAIRDFRLRLLALTKETLAEGLQILGLPAPDVM